MAKYKEIKKDESLLSAISRNDKKKIKELEEKSKKGEIIRLI